MRRLPILLFAIGLIMLSSPAWCNPVAPDKLSMLPMTGVFDFVVDLFFIMLALLVVRRGEPRPAKMVLTVACLAMIAGLCADFAGRYVGDLVSSLDKFLHLGIHSYHLRLLEFASRVLVPTPLIFVANWLLGRAGFGLTSRQAVRYALVVAVATAPFESAEFAWSGDDHILMILGGVFLLFDVVLLLAFRSGRQLGLPTRITVAICALAIILPSFAGRSYQVLEYMRYERAQACRNQLYQVRFAFEIYRDDKGDAYPPDLVSMVPKYLDREFTHCPIPYHGHTGSAYRYRRPPGGEWLDPDMRVIMVSCPVHHYAVVCTDSGYLTIEGAKHNQAR